MEIKVQQIVHELELQLPTRGTPQAAAYDLYCAEETILPAYHPTLVPTNMQIELPAGHALFIMPRSGNALKKNLIVVNSPGLIDEDFRGHVQVILMWIPHPMFSASVQKAPQSLLIPGQNPNQNVPVPTCIKIEKGERIAQAFLIKTIEQDWIKVDELSTTERGDGGFGSTGEK